MISGTRRLFKFNLIFWSISFGISSIIFSFIKFICDFIFGCFLPDCIQGYCCCISCCNSLICRYIRTCSIIFCVWYLHFCLISFFFPWCAVRLCHIIFFLHHIFFWFYFFSGFCPLTGFLSLLCHICCFKKFLNRISRFISFTGSIFFRIPLFKNVPCLSPQCFRYFSSIRICIGYHICFFQFTITVKQNVITFRTLSGIYWIFCLRLFRFLIF